MSAAHFKVRAVLRLPAVAHPVQAHLVLAVPAEDHLALAAVAVTLLPVHLH